MPSPSFRHAGRRRQPRRHRHNIQTHELLYRSGLAAHLLVTTTNVFLAVIFYELFKVVNQRLALLDAFFILVATAIEAAGLLNQFTPLVLSCRELLTKPSGGSGGRWASRGTAAFRSRSEGSHGSVGLR
jgi:hypothetical protein